MAPPDKPTLEQVAEVAGVSRATVSRVVRGTDNVSRTTRAAVHDAIEQVGYVPNQAARSLVTRRTDAVALVVAESEQRVFAEPFFAPLARGAAEELTDRGRQMVLVMASTPDDERRLLTYLSGGHVDGVMLLSLRVDDPLPAALVERGVALSMAGAPPDDVDVPWVDADNLHGGEQAARHLVVRGRRRIGVLAGPQAMAVGRDRLEGWRRALAAAGLEPEDSLVAVGDFSQDSGEAGMEELLGREPELDGVVAASDLMAAGALRVATAGGRRVPEDIAIVGFDDSVVARSSSPSLTSVRQPIHEMGRVLAELVVDAIDGGPADTHRVLATELVVRDST